MIYKRSVLVLALLVSCWTASFISAQASAQATAAAPAEHRKTSEPYTGDLSIFDSPGRDERLQVNRVMDILGIRPGKTVADVGAGSGWFTVRAARRVGAGGVVYAVDINPDSIRYIDARAEKEQLRNVKTILGKTDDPLLPTGAIDAVLLLKTYHEVAEPVALCETCGPRFERALKSASLTAMEMAKITEWDAMSSSMKRLRRATGCWNSMTS